MISYYLPPLIKMREWKLLYSINKDGVSMQTFFHKVKNRDHTAILIEDTDGFIFGSYTCEHWHVSNHFYGTGEGFVFTFGNEEDMKVF
mmetsp:Transcript_32817/g.32041  ORF Transcript_32817/g.32041 Transcript_32817/m.32041 type:complete len:88 (-) Transcript_32817:193-456(-)